MAGNIIDWKADVKNKLKTLSPFFLIVHDKHVQRVTDWISGCQNKRNGAKGTNIYCKNNLLQDNVAILVSNDRGQYISFRECSTKYPLRLPKDQPIQG